MSQQSHMIESSLELPWWSLNMSTTVFRQVSIELQINKFSITDMCSQNTFLILQYEWYGITETQTEGI